MKLSSQIDPRSESFQSNREYHLRLSETLASHHARVREGGGKDAQAYQRKLGKMLVRERVQALLDPGCDLLELSRLAGHELYPDDVPGGGMVTGVGPVHDQLVMVIANDATVKGGTYYPITVKKHLRAQEIAAKNHLPCVYIVDSGGAFLPLQDQVFPDRDHFGRIFYNQARMSARGIPQIASVNGFCTAGGAYIPAMSDQSVIVAKTGTIFLAGPPLVKAATGEEVSALELGGSTVHTEISGVADHAADDDPHSMAILRQIVRSLKTPDRAQSVALREPRPPAYNPEEILGILPSDPRKFFDIREIIARLVDNSELFEFKRNYGTTLVTGFAHLGGIPVGILANNGVLMSESALKGAHFIELCCAQATPLLFLQNITGFIVGRQYEHQGIAKDGAKMVHAVANAEVPKVTLVMGGSFGAGNYAMAGRAFDSDFMFTWPQARIAVMGGEQAADVLATVKMQKIQREGRTLSADEIAALRRPIRDQYEVQSSPYYATARLWDDGILDPLETRQRLIQALSTTLVRPWSKTRFGTFRM